MKMPVHVNTIILSSHKIYLFGQSFSNAILHQNFSKHIFFFGKFDNQNMYRLAKNPNTEQRLINEICANICVQNMNNKSILNINQ